MKVYLVRTYYDGETTKHPTSTKIETIDRRFAAECFEDAETMAKKVMDPEETISFICEESPHIHLPRKKLEEIFEININREKAMADARASYILSKQVEQDGIYNWPTESGRLTWEAVVDAVLACIQKE